MKISSDIMNDLQKTQVEMLKLFLHICNKLKLTPFLVCGSALGAVKYNGFIPWDDDIDVALIREEYEVFIKEAPTFLDENYFLQNIHTECAFPLLMTKLRKSDTTMIEKQFSHLPINHGVYLDIFPLDGYPNGKMKGKMFEIKKWLYNKARCVAYIYGYKFFKLNTIMISYENLLKKYTVQNSSLICNHANWQGKLEYSTADVYGNGSKAIFEGVEVLVPEKYDHYFTQKYGDWRSEPDAENQQSHHIVSLINLTKPYTEYLK